MRLDDDAFARFFEKVEVTEDGCWRWTSKTSRHGYGMFWWLGKQHRAHRVSYEHFRGFPVPPLLDHQCNRRWCVNPWCVDSNTRSGNVLRASKPNCPKGHPMVGDNVLQVKTKTGTKRRCKACQAAYMAKWYQNNKGH